MACGGVATRAGGMSASAGGAGAAADGVCAEPASEVPDAGVFQAPPIGALGAYLVTFHNRCAQTVWPAWASSGGLDNSVIDTQLWLPMSPASDRTVTVYGGVREIEFWGRTGCSFDQAGRGACQTGECGGFVCRQFPMNATIFELSQGFLGGYNVGLRIEGPTCGKHECVADIGTCSHAPAVQDRCGSAIACSDICGGSTAQCCSQPGSGCSSQPLSGDRPGTGDLVITFCP
jgi:Thaumatin family